MSKYWGKEEKAYLLKHAKTLHPVDILPELNTKFGNNRTFKALTNMLSECKVPYKHLIRPPDAMDPVDPQFMDEEGMRKELSKMGYKVEKRGLAEVDRKFKIDTSMFEGETSRFAVISCTQLGSRFQQLTFLKNFYKYIENQGIKVVLHCGDFVDGEKMYRGHEYELFLHGCEAQKDYAINEYPELKNGKTYVIMGNHDECYWKQNGVNILQGIAKDREDIVYLGRWGAYPKIGGLNIYMAHGTGGVAYARSYKLQKNIEQFAPAKKPDLYFIGHWHVSAALFEYRNVTAFMIPCFQSQTPYLKAKGLYPEIGGFIVEVVSNDTFRKDGTARIKWEFIPFFVPRDDDF